MREAFTTLDAAGLPVLRPNFDTDQIIPARFLSRDRDLGLGECLFRDLRFERDGAERPEFGLNQPGYRDARVVVGEHNFACGSSRENAVWALHDYGFRAAIAPSFGDIFRNNCFKNGMLPVVLPREVCDQLMHDTGMGGNARLTVDLERQVAVRPDGEEIGFTIDPLRKHLLLEGLDDIAQTLQRTDAIDRFEQHRAETQSWMPAIPVA